MGMIDRFLGMGAAASTLSSAATNMAEIFRVNATREMELEGEAYGHAIQQLTAEFGAERRGRFDDFVNGLNRLPRPLLTLGTIGLFVYAMAAPEGFMRRMAGLDTVPEPVWWLLGAVVSFYFGAREAHYFRANHYPRRIVSSLRPVPEDPAIGAAALDAAVAAALAAQPRPEPHSPADPAAFPDNAALRDWAISQRQGGVAG